jgi:hypothetical protein
LEKAKKEFKSCLKIEPEDDSAKKYLTMIYKQEKSLQMIEFENLLQKKRYNK